MTVTGGHRKHCIGIFIMSIFSITGGVKRNVYDHI